ncbi:aminopeptidase LapA [Legionella micdadei]|uniref:aminopeptidase LapA n=1 Tax=Legionella micdadei TaxID=451 RepID=UPI003A7F6C81
MRFYSWTYVVAFIMTINPCSTIAQKPATEQLQLPQCLAVKLPQTHPLLAENTQFKIIDFPSTELNSLVLLADQVSCGRFVNVSHHFKTTDLAQKQKIASKLLSKSAKPTFLESPQHYEIKHKAAVKSVFSKISEENIWQTLTHLTSYYNRSATQPTGVETAEWLKAQFESLAMEYGRQDTEAYFVATGSNYRQPSLVTVIGKESHEPAIVIGAHMDTLDGRMPGAGDDASGSAVVLETARILLASQIEFKRPVYLIWYAAEERGLVGSQFVVQELVTKKKIPVKAAIQFDMTGYRSDENNPTMWIFRDYTDPQLSDFVAELIKIYVNAPVAYSKCGYGCSDHASWMAAGIPAAFPCETSFAEHNPHIHTSADTLSLLNTEHMTNFTKLALAFAIELAK